MLNGPDEMSTACEENVIDKHFCDGYNEANDLYGDGCLHECIEKSSALLADTEMPRYYRMKTLLLLASTLGDWDEADTCHRKAEMLWNIVRRWNPVGEDETLDIQIAGLHTELDELKHILEAEERKDSEDDTMSDDDLYEQEEVDEQKEHGMQDKQKE